MKLIQYSLVSVVVVLCLGATYLAVVDKDSRANYSSLTSQAITGLFALATGGAMGYQVGKSKDEDPKV